MSQENMDTVQRALAAVNDRDVDGYLSCCTNDVVLSTPAEGVTGLYQGADGIRRFFDDLAETGPDFHLAVERLEAVDADRVLAFLRVTATGRTSGVPTEAVTGNIYDFAQGKLERIRIFLDRDHALEAAGLSK